MNPIPRICHLLFVGTCRWYFGVRTSSLVFWPKSAFKAPITFLVLREERTRGNSRKRLYQQNESKNLPNTWDQTFQYLVVIKNIQIKKSRYSWFSNIYIAYNLGLYYFCCISTSYNPLYLHLAREKTKILRNPYVQTLFVLKNFHDIVRFA